MLRLTITSSIGAIAPGISSQVSADGAGAFDGLGDVAGLLVYDSEVLFIHEIFRKAENQLQGVVDVACDVAANDPRPASLSAWNSSASSVD